ncbi:MAG TPA: sialidase family protein [Chthoniobacterales bacterium]|nr:sialidase family protein [Chthoniobacterales bacterium]
MSKASIFSCLVLLSAFAIASGQDSPRKPLPTEPHETYGDPPAPMILWGTGVSPGMVSPHGGFTSFQVNVNLAGQNIVGDAANEPSITVDPTNGNKMSIGWRQFNSVTSNFRQAGWGYTTNGGMSWTFPGVLENNVFRSDPVLYFDDIGRFFYNSLLGDFFDDQWGSTNGGQTYTRLGPATGGDKQWITIDNTNSTGRGFQYQCWSTAGNNWGGRQFSRSTDGGVSWRDPVFIPSSPVWGTLDVDSNGLLYIGGTDFGNGQFWCVRSSNARDGSATPSFDQVTAVNLGGNVVFSEMINPAGLAGQVFLAVDRSGTSTNNNIYMLATVQPTGANNGTDVMFVRSTNGGQTFSAPRRINDDPVNPNKWHWFGTFAVAPNGRIDSVWLDTRNAANNTDSQLFYSYSLDAGNTWSPNVSVSAPFNPFLGYPNQNKIGDYITMVSDNTGGNVAYAATFNLEEDIYYVRVAPGVAPTPTPGTPTPTPPATPTPTPTTTPPATPTPTLTPSPTSTPTSTPTPPATATPTPSASPTSAAQAINLSTRMRVQTGDNVGIGGFIITGDTPKHVLIRAIGPSLTQFGVPNVLADPVLELNGPGSFVTITNNDWRDDPVQEALIKATGIPPTNDLESAIEARLVPGSYTAIVRGNGNTSGVGLVEVYDLNSETDSKLSNLSTRTFVSTGDNIVIAGFVLGGDSGDDRIVVRGIGPSLAGLGVPNPLANPTLELRDSNGALLFANNDWQDNPAQAAELIDAGLAPTNNLESAMAITLPPGSYTALLAGVNNSTGIGLVEVYDRGAP